MNKGRKTTGAVLIGIGVLVAALKLSGIYDPFPPVEKASEKAGPAVAQFVKNMGPAITVYGILAGVPFLIGALLAAGGKKREEEAPAATVETVAPAVVKVGRNGTRNKPVQSCTVLQAGTEQRQIWHFEARNGGLALDRQQTAPSGQPLPQGMLAKRWTSLWQRKVNVAWLPAEKVFLRVAQLPKSDFQETVSMVELQLEKLSPMPVAQIVWSLHLLPNSTPGMQTVVVVIAARDAVEQFLGQLEGEGYLADELEIPILDQLQATPLRKDGVYIYPEGLGANAGLAAWWYGGVLQNLDLVNLSAADRGASLREQVTQMAWAGELEGWLTTTPAVYVVGSPESAAAWEPALREGLEQPVELIEPLPPAQLAAATANRIARRVNGVKLLPPEYSERYQQQFVDRLWMRGLVVVCGLYLVGVAIYMVALAAASYRTSNVEQQVASLSNTYTNAIQIKARYALLKDREDLKYAALECWKALAERLPENFTLESFNFSGGKRLTLHGTAPMDAAQQIIDFEKSLRSATLANGEPLFDLSKTENLTTHQGSNKKYNWDWVLELKHSSELL